MLRKFRLSHLFFLFLSLLIGSTVFSLSSYNFQVSPQPSAYLEWEQTYNEYQISGGQGIAVDNDNNVIIVGNYYNSSKESYDRVLLKYDNEGKMIWNQTLDHQVFGINSIGTDSLDNIYVVGEYEVNSTNSDFFLSKYNSSGDLTWQRIWGGIEYDGAYSVCLDTLDNVYIVGISDSYDLMGKVVILKYNSSGILKWSANWSCSDTDYPCDIEIDLEGNIYITGYNMVIDTTNVFLVKLNSSGDLQWNKTWGGDYMHIGYSLAIDSSNNVYLTGMDQGIAGLYHDIFVYKVNVLGELLWNHTYSGGGHHIGYSIALDSNEYVYVAGVSNADICLLKLNNSGNEVWHKIWGSEHSEQAYAMAIDDIDNIFLTGYEQQEVDGDEYLLLLKFSSVPDEFELTSNAGTPDPDGSFTLNWSESLDADNYSLYRSDSAITKINSSISKVVSKNYNRTFSFANLTEGEYYYLAVAFNEYGNTSSNCINVKVQYPPGEFTLNNHSSAPDTDGMINLTWSISESAEYYSVYMDDTIIDDIGIEQMLVANNLTECCLTIDNLTNGEYYYIILAINDAGEALSNCINLSVRRAPNSFMLISDAGTPYDEDGAFELIWTHSEYATNYTVYISNYSIDVMNDSLKELYTFSPSFEWPTYRYNLCHCSGTGLSNGTYYFVIVATNEHGEYRTECLEIEVRIPKEKSDEGDTSDIFKYVPQVLLYSTIGCLLLAMIIIYGKIRK